MRHELYRNLGSVVRFSLEQGRDAGCVDAGVWLKGKADSLTILNLPGFPSAFFAFKIGRRRTARSMVDR